MDEYKDKDLSEQSGATGDQSPVSADIPSVGAEVVTNQEQIQKAAEASQKSVIAEEKEIGSGAEAASGPVGLDIGSSHIIAAQSGRDHIHSVKQLNAFFTVPRSKFAERILAKNEVMYFESEGQFYIYGNAADNFANMFNTNTRRPVLKGILSANEAEGIHVIQAVISSLIKKPKKFGETLCFAIPGEPLNGTGSVVYHESTIKTFLGKMGYTPISINEGMAIVMSELGDDDYTGIGISMGGGMCNICLSYLSYPVITYSIQEAGDYIDAMAGMSVGVSATRVKAQKEAELDLSREPRDRITAALHVFYENLIHTLLESLQQTFNATDQLPKISRPIPIVLSGGTAMPKGCREGFEKALKTINLPVEISTVRLASDPLNTTAKGALIMALAESQ
jgi:hypothetical protein